MLKIRREGLKIVLVDIDETKLEAAAKSLAAKFGEANILAVPTDVSKLDQVQALADRTLEAFGEVKSPFGGGGLVSLLAGQRPYEQRRNRLGRELYLVGT